jgi:hypothetical protein
MDNMRLWVPKKKQYIVKFGGKQMLDFQNSDDQVNKLITLVEMSIGVQWAMLHVIGDLVAAAKPSVDLYTKMNTLAELLQEQQRNLNAGISDNSPQSQ